MRRTTAVLALLMIGVSSGCGEDPRPPLPQPSFSATDRATATPTPSNPTTSAAPVAGDVSRRKPALLRLSGGGQRARLRVIALSYAFNKSQWEVDATLDNRSARRFAQISRSAGAGHQTLTVSTRDGTALARVRAPQPLMYAAFQFPGYPTRADAVAIVNLITKSRG